MFYFIYHLKLQYIIYVLIFENSNTNISYKIIYNVVQSWLESTLLRYEVHGYEVHLNWFK